MFLPIPFGTDRPQRRFPIMNIALIAANVLVYLVSHQALSPARGVAPSAFWLNLMLWPTHPHLYQFITYQFLHEGLGHIFFNMLFLYVFGNNLNEKLGHIGYLLFYLTGGVLAGCGQVLSSNAPTLGASGAISAVTGLFIVLLPRTHIRIFIWIFIYVDVWEIPSAFFVLFNVAQDAFEPILWQSTKTAYAAHLTGNLAGFLIGLLLLLARLVQRDHYDLLALFDRYRRRKQYEAVVASGYNPFGPGRSVLADTKPKRGQPAAPPPDPRIEALRFEIGGLIHSHQLAAAAQKYLELRQVAPSAVLGADDQLDIANQLMAEARYPEAAAAYEDYLQFYANTSQNEHVMLVLGLIYTQYLLRPERAKELFRGVIPRLHDAAQRRFAEEELARLEAPHAPNEKS